MKLFKRSIRHARRNVDAEDAILSGLLTSIWGVFVSLLSLGWTGAKISANEHDLEAVA